MRKKKEIKVILSILFITSIGIIPVLKNKTSALDSDFAVNVTGETITSYTGTATDIEIPEQINGIAITTIGQNTFFNKQLTSVVIPDSITTIGVAAFSTNKLTSITIPDTVKTIGSSAFYYNQLSNVILPESLETIEWETFAYNNLTSITIPSSVTMIGQQAFTHNQLVSIVIPSSVKTIDQQAFSFNQLSSIIIPESVTKIGANAFKNQDGNSYYIKKDNKYIYQFSKEMNLTKIDITTLPEGSVYDSAKGTITSQTDLLSKNLEYEYTVSNSTVTAAQRMNVILYLIPLRHHVIFQDDDGKQLYEDTIDSGNNVNPNVTPKKEGYTFIGWDKELKNITADTTFIAQYKKLPVIPSIDDVEHKQGEPFDPKGPIIVKDAEGNIITDIEITDNPVDIDKEGTYTVTYKATDKWGGVITGNYQVIIEKDSSSVGKPDQPDDGDANNSVDENIKNSGSVSPIIKDSNDGKDTLLDIVKTNDMTNSPMLFIMLMMLSFVLISITIGRGNKSKTVLKEVYEQVIEVADSPQVIVNKPKDFIEVHQIQEIKETDNKGLLWVTMLSTIAIGFLMIMKRNKKD